MHIYADQINNVIQSNENLRIQLTNGERTTRKWMQEH